jgi:predicted SnoaL-like aldol condensation-catalyzing enzyme
MKTIFLTLSALMLAFGMCGAQAGESPATRTLLQRHLSAFLDNDLETVLSDYTDESTLVTADATYTGRQAIRGFFARLIPLFPRQQSRLDLDRMVVDGELAFIVWHATTPAVKVTLGTDTFVLKDGKIHRQTFVGQMQQEAGAAGTAR